MKDHLTVHPGEERGPTPTTDGLFCDQDTAERLLEHLQASSSDHVAEEYRIPVGNYFDPDHAARERSAMRRHPIVVAHASQLPERGSFITTDLLGVRLIVVRQDDGSVRAFRNVCLHRGGRIEDDPSGTKRVFTCRYHGWTYDRDGSLRHIPYDEFFPASAASCAGMTAVHAEERHQLLWVQLEGEAVDVATYLGPRLDGELSSVGLDEWQLYLDRSIDHDMNWKLVMDGLIDVLHPKFLHPNSVGKMIETNAHVFSSFGRHAKWSMARRALTKMRDDVPAGTDLRSYVISAYYIYPNVMLSVMPEHHELWVVHPDARSATASRTALRFLVPPDQPEAQRLSTDKSYDLLMDAVFGEDWPMAQSIQDGVAEAGVSHFVCGTSELPIQNLHRQLEADLATLP